MSGRMDVLPEVSLGAVSILHVLIASGSFARLTLH